MYKIVFVRKAAKEYDALETKIQNQLDAKISLLQKGDHAMLDITKIVGRTNTYRLRSGDYRIIYEHIDDILTITVIKIGHRKEAYKNF
jgi:mRNA interferase RelE/StbE